MNENIIEIKTNKELTHILAEMNKLRMGAYINFSGIITGRITFHKLFAALDNKNFKILLQDKLQNDIMSIDRKYISKIEKSIDNGKLILQIETEEKENEIITVEF